jgi:hypothetical protein
MENHISGGKFFLCGKVIKTVAFLTEGVTKKHTPTSPCIKLVFREKIGGITQTTEYSQNRVIGRSVM